MSKTWRDSCRPLIAKIILENQSLDEKELRKVISKAYPWGERAMHPYKIWCSEVKKQLTAFNIKKKQLPPGGLFAPEPEQEKLF